MKEGCNQWHGQQCLLALPRPGWGARVRASWLGGIATGTNTTIIAVSQAILRPVQALSRFRSHHVGPAPARSPVRAHVAQAEQRDLDGGAAIGYGRGAPVTATWDAHR